MTSCGSNHRPPKFHQHSTRPSVSSNPRSPSGGRFGSVACRMDVREAKAKALIKKQRLGPESHTTMMRRSLDVSRPQGKAKGSLRSPSPRDRQVDQSRSSPAAPTGTRRFNPYILPERRRIVAQVRRKVPKNQDFSAFQDSLGRCDDLLTTGVDNADRAGL